MDQADTAQLAAVLGALGALFVLLPGPRVQLLAGIGVLAAAEIVFGISLSPDVPGGSLAVLALLAVLVLGGGAAGFVRRPDLVPPIVLAAAPFRLPLQFGSENRYYVAIAEQGSLGRLLPLYAVLGAATLALAYRVVRGSRVVAIPMPIAVPAGAFIAFASLSLLWSDDLDAGRDLLAYFVLPFAVLLAVVARAPFADWLPKALAWIAVALAALFAVIGLVEAGTRNLLFSAPNVDVGNAYSSLFRVTSLFRDPNLYGRHVVLGIVVLVVVLCFVKLGARAALLVALLWAGLYFSHSQSSMAALFVVVLAIAVIMSGRSSRAVIAGLAVAVVIASGALLAVEIQDDSARRVTSGRSLRIEDTARVAAGSPITGVGIGSQPLASRREADRDAPLERFVSHTTPLTIVAELGIIGLALYVALLAGTVATILEVRRRDPSLGLGLGAALLALFVHSLFYSGFFEDPMTWFVIAVAAGSVAWRSEEATEPSLAVRTPRATVPSG
jgi:O-antigen ligase